MRGRLRQPVRTARDVPEYGEKTSHIGQHSTPFHREIKNWACARAKKSCDMMRQVNDQWCPFFIMRVVNKSPYGIMDNPHSFSVARRWAEKNIEEENCEFAEMFDANPLIELWIFN